MQKTIMDPRHLEEIQNNDILQQRLAKFMAKWCFRNTILEDFHGKKGSKFSGRISQEEMELITKDFVNHCYQFIGMFFTTTHANGIIDGMKEKDACPELADPESTFTPQDFEAFEESVEVIRAALK